jgi:hypothetical protein
MRGPIDVKRLIIRARCGAMRRKWGRDFVGVRCNRRRGLTWQDENYVAVRCAPRGKGRRDSVCRRDESDDAVLPRREER